MQIVLVGGTRWVASTDDLLNVLQLSETIEKRQGNKKRTPLF